MIGHLVLARAKVITAKLLFIMYNYVNNIRKSFMGQTQKSRETHTNNR